MVQVGVMENQKNVPQTLEWTLEHHKLFVDLLPGGIEKPRAFVLKRMMKTVKGLTWSTALGHSRHFENLQKKTLSVLSRRRPPPRNPSCELRVLLDDLLRGLEGLTMECKLSTWTLEHHKRVLDAVAKVGGLDTASSMEKTAVRVLSLMEEERRQGLTVRTVTEHLIGLRYLQRRTQEAIVKAAENKARHGNSARRPKKVKVGRRKNNNGASEYHGLSDYMPE